MVVAYLNPSTPSSIKKLRLLSFNEACQLYLTKFPLVQTHNASKLLNRKIKILGSRHNNTSEHTHTHTQFQTFEISLTNVLDPTVSHGCHDGFVDGRGLTGINRVLS